jgi:hypothetical protein
VRQQERGGETDQKWRFKNDKNCGVCLRTCAVVKKRKREREDCRGGEKRRVEKRFKPMQAKRMPTS